MDRIAQLTDEQCRITLEQIYNGDLTPMPANIQQAEHMKLMAEWYIAKQHRVTIDALKKDYV